VLKPLSVLIVDDEPAAGEILALLVSEEGHLAVRCESGVQAFQRLQLARPNFDIVITDHHMPGSLDGLGFVRLIRARGLPQRVIVTSGHMTDELREEYRKYSVCGFLPKPFDTKLLRTYLFTTQLLHSRAPEPVVASVRARP
jgi:CheY-like chemotaxis protein